MRKGTSHVPIVFYLAHLMRINSIFIILLLAACGSPAGEKSNTDKHAISKQQALDKLGIDPSKLNVVVAWNETCPMCKASRIELKAVMAAFPYANWHVLRVDSFSNPGYGKSFESSVHEWPDEQGLTARSLDFTVTPAIQIFVGDAGLKFFGPVDDRGIEIGRYKSEIGKHILREKLMQLSQDTSTGYEKMKAVGCFLPN